MGSGNDDPQDKLGITIAFLIAIPIITKWLAGAEKRDEASEPPASCHANHYLGNHYLGKNAVLTLRKETEVKEEDSKLG